MLLAHFPTEKKMQQNEVPLLWKVGFLKEYF